MNWIVKILIAAAIDIVLAVASFWLVEKSFAGALRGLRTALKQELTTDTGRVNLAGMVLLAFGFIFISLHDMASKVLGIGETSARSEYVPLFLLMLLGLFFIGSLICLAVVERKR